MKMTSLDRILLLVTGVLAAYQLAIGIEGLTGFPIVAYTVAFGVLLVAGLLLVILGFDVLDSPGVVIASTIIPLSISLGLVWQYLPLYQIPYLTFAIVGLLLIVLTRSISLPGKLPAIILTVVHGIAGLIICMLPILFSLQNQKAPLFALVGLGGALIGISGLLLSFLKAGRPILSRTTLFKILPGLLLLMMACFVVGFSYG